MKKNCEKKQQKDHTSNTRERERKRKHQERNKRNQKLSKTNLFRTLFLCESLEDSAIRLTPGTVIEVAGIDMSNEWIVIRVQGKRLTFPVNCFTRLSPHDRVGASDEPAPSTIPGRACASPKTAREKFRVIHDFACEDRFALRSGDIVEVTKKEPSRWWEGEIGGKQVRFPAGFVSPIDRTSEEKEEMKPVRCPVKAIFSYRAEEEGDLTFNVGDVIDVIARDDESCWWTGEIHGRVGKFPAANVQTIPPTPEQQLLAMVPPKRRPICRVYYDYYPSTPTEIPLRDGDFLEVVVDDADDSGWKVGVVNGVCGWFPISWIDYSPTKFISDDDDDDDT